MQLADVDTKMLRFEAEICQKDAGVFPIKIELRAPVPIVSSDQGRMLGSCSLKEDNKFETIVSASVFWHCPERLTLENGDPMFLLIRDATLTWITDNMAKAALYIKVHSLVLVTNVDEYKQNRPNPWDDQFPYLNNWFQRPTKILNIERP